MARIVMATFGSLGDLHPFLAVGLRLQAAGHEVVVATAEFHRARIEAAGLGFAAMRPDFADIERDQGYDAAEGLRRMMAREDWIFREVLFPYVRQSYEDSLRILADADLVLTSTFAFGSRLAAEVLGVPRVAVGLQPLAFFSAYDPPQLGRTTLVTELAIRAGPGPTRLLIALGSRLAAGWARPYRQLREELGLPPEPSAAIYTGHFMASAMVGLYSPLFGEVKPDFPAGTELVGSAFYDSETGGEPTLEPELARFLDAGPPPVVFSLGSTAVEVGEQFYGESLKAAARLGRRAVLLVGADHVSRWRPAAGESVFVAGYAPHSLVFPRAAAVVHHGGVGTCSQGLRAGVPQLVVPFLGDQPDNAARLGRLGLAKTLPQERYTAARAAKRLRDLLERPDYAKHARRAAEVVAQEDGAGRLAEIVQRVLAEPSRRTG